LGQCGLWPLAECLLGENDLITPMMTENLTAFFDLDEFATTHNFNGTAGVLCVVGDKITGRSEVDGTWVEMFEVSFMVSAITIPTKRQQITFDSKTQTVERVKNDGAVVTITLSNARAGEMIRDMMGTI